MSARGRIHSMTGYAHVNVEHRLGHLTLEIRSVNSRFLDLAFRLPDELRALEPALREALQSSLARGKVDVRAGLHGRTAGDAGISINPLMLASLAQAQEEVRQHMPNAAALSVGETLRFPGVVIEPVADPGQWVAAFQPLVGQALVQLTESRAREGERLRALILERAQTMLAIVQDHAIRAPELLRQHEARLIERLKSAAQQALATTPLPLDETLARIRQEVALHGMKSDVVEELQRLEVHLQELATILNQGGAVGRKLDFLLQEFNREANTLGSKASDLQTSRASMDLKLLIEQIREQVQNLE